MRSRKSLVAAATIVATILLALETFAWGFWAHKQVTGRAIGILPGEMKAFFDANRDYITEHSVDPDIARRADSLEQFNHYLDIDYYGAYPFSQLPRDYNEAMKKFGMDTLRTYGLLPWKIAEYTAILSDAMKRGDKQDILKGVTYLAHYVEDSFVPLHTTLNYDGQLTDQKGLHRRFESDIPERYGEHYLFNLKETPAEIHDPLEFAFEIVLQSYTYVDTVLGADRRIRSELSPDKIKVETENNGRRVTRYSTEYFERFNELLNDLPRQRMEAAIVATARYWYTAWVNAGKPRLVAE